MTLDSYLAFCRHRNNIRETVISRKLDEEEDEKYPSANLALRCRWKIQELLPHRYLDASQFPGHLNGLVVFFGKVSVYESIGSVGRGVRTG